MGLLRRDGDSVTDAVLSILVGQLRHRKARRQPAMTVASVHRVGAGSKWLAFAASVRRVPGVLSVDNVRSDGQHALRMRRVAIGRMLANLVHESGDDIRCYGV